MTKYCLFIFCFYLFVCWLVDWLLVLRWKEGVGQDRFKKPSLSKWGQVQNLSCEHEFYLHENEISLRIKSWALNLVLIQRPEGTRKWPVSMWVQFFFACESQGPVAWKFRLKSWCFYIQDRGFKTDFADNTNYGTDREKGAPVPKLFNALTVGCISPLMPFPIPNIIFL